MWVQGSIEFKNPLLAGWHSCQEDLKFIKELKKDHFVALKRTVRDENGTEVANEQRTLIYTKQPVAETSAKLRQLQHFKNTYVVTFTDIDIMEYSSFSSNPHRIHWDRDYTRNVEGYRDIIVQGPFLVQFVIDYCEHLFGRSVSSIKYKNTCHVYAGTDVEVCHNGLESDGKANVVLRDAKNPQKVYFESKVA
ncbi:unnamed protein product [Kluyveromyces dobzhanskii CBS 2104]|uniref:WGS project CCBQ000000000 data, contig 00012 n=1 Tax=Kluyveromyces dobzhanskii CBS 2104 TaxID=1427455 RepID=A0A0A8L134_9SACH|nr:unnamed protein product [Kluyveromyces dobzhanskii CBS 2104]